MARTIRQLATQRSAIPSSYTPRSRVAISKRPLEVAVNRVASAKFTKCPFCGCFRKYRFVVDRVTSSMIQGPKQEPPIMRYELSDVEWGIIAPMLPHKPRGVPRVDDRRVLNGIFWTLRSGAPWRDLPSSFGPYTTCYNRFARWRQASGTGSWRRQQAPTMLLAAKRCAWVNIPPRSHRNEPPVSLPGAQHGGAVLQQDQTVSSGRNAL